jgi:co-chaperonin GroES (HSP10)
MPQTREQIKHSPVASEAWRDNHTSVMWFDPRKIKPLGNHMLVELDDEKELSSVITTPDVARNCEIGSRIGTVLAIGPGRWREKRNFEESWILNPLIFQPTVLKPGDRVVIGHYSDWESWNCGADGHQSRDRNIVLCQEADARLILPVEFSAHA